MSGITEQKECLCCGETVETYTDWKPTDTFQCYCHHCGFYEESIRGFTTLEELNREREYQNELGCLYDDELDEKITLSLITEDEYKVILKQREERRKELRYHSLISEPSFYEKVSL